MRFTKMHGLGNDFIVIDAAAQQLDIDKLEKNAKLICDRRFGVGGDGLILALPSSVADLGMRVINSDGSEAEMCGNGIRCLAKYAYDHGTHHSDAIAVETLAGIKTVQITARDGKADVVRVDMGSPEFRRNLIPMTGDDSPVVQNELLKAGELELSVTCVSMGNPHCVTFVEDVEGYPVALVGPQFETHPVFPKRTNVEFVQILSSDEIKMRVWERGAGETLACGTGACASAIASSLAMGTSRRVLVRLAGGDLDIEWTADNRVYMTGSATEVFSGEYDLTGLS